MSVSGYWLLSMVMIFGAILIYFTMTPAFEEVYMRFHNATTSDDPHTTQNLVMFVWNAWCPIVIMGALVIGFVGSQRRDPSEAY